MENKKLKSVPILKYKTTLKSIEYHLREIEKARGGNERNYHIGLVKKMIREEMFLHEI